MLDLPQITEQILAAGRRERERQEQADADAARAVLQATGGAGDYWEIQRERIRASRTSWLVAHPLQGSPGDRFPASPTPLPPHVVVATDGSQIAPDRHDGIGGCYLLNVGRVFLTYGTGTRPRLDTRAEVLAADTGEDDDSEDEPETRAIAGLGLRRFAREMRELSGLIEEAAATGLPALALTDGSLIAWQLYDETGADPAKQEALAALREALEVSERTRVPLVGYVSGPGSRDAINGLRITLCPEETVDCARCPYPRNDKPCFPVRRATDAALYSRLLQTGERSAVYTSSAQRTGFSKVLPLYGPAHWVAFFYLQVGAEIARIELPHWVTEDTALIDRVQMMCLDQARKGRGYPVALSEAHERAVVRGADRQAFLNLLQRTLVGQGRPVLPTRKALAKRTRAL